MRNLRNAAGSLVAIGAMLATAACNGPSGGNQDSVGPEMLTVGVAQLPTTLDPGQAAYRQQGGVMALTAGTLTVQDGKKMSMGLAESVTASENRFVVKLKPNLKFSDGSSLTATDVVASFEHYMADKTNAMAALYAKISKVTAEGDLVVNFDLKQPYPDLPSALSMWSSAIIPSKVIKARSSEDLYKGDPLPTAGQFQIKSFGANDVTLQANPNYEGRHPATKTVVFKKIADTPARLAQVQSGQIDFADGISPKQQGQLTDPVQIRAAAANPGAIFLQMNNRDNSVLSDVLIRQAISAAVDRDQINQVAYGGLSKPAYSIWGSESPYNSHLLPERVDVSRAQESLAGTKCAAGCELALIVDSSNQPYVDAATVVQQNLKAVGITVNINQAENATINEKKSQGNFDLAIGSNYDYTASSYLSYVLGPDSNALLTGYSSPDMNRLADKIAITDGSEREATIPLVNKLFTKDIPFLPLVDYNVVSASRVPAEAFNIETGSFLYRVG